MVVALDFDYFNLDKRWILLLSRKAEVNIKKTALFSLPLAAGGFAYWYFFMRRPEPVLIVLSDGQKILDFNSKVDFLNHLKSNYTPTVVGQIEKFIFDSSTLSRDTEQRVFILEMTPGFIVKLHFEQEGKELVA